MTDRISPFARQLTRRLTALVQSVMLRPVNVTGRASHGHPRVTIRGIPTTPWLARLRLPALSRRRDRVAVLIDGLNLHHSIQHAARGYTGQGASPWVDVRGLCDAQLHLISSTAVIGDLHYFYTFAEHLEPVRPGIVQAHRDYTDALTAVGVMLHFGRFKRGRVRCPLCRGRSFQHEEKETDVAIGAKLIELAVTGACDVIVLASGDTDLIPAIRTARRLAPDIQIWIAFPFGRRNRELAHVADGTFRLGYQQYVQHQLPPSVTLPDGRIVRKPAIW